MPEATRLEPEVDEPATRTMGRRVAGDLSARLAGWGAITFAVVVIAQNVIRGASAPGNGASAAQVLSHYSGDGAVPYVLAATYVASGVGMALFLGGITRTLFATDRAGWAITGLVGALGIVTVFTLVVAAEQAISVAAHMDRPQIGAIQALWALHNSIFSVLDLFIALALLGLSRAAVAAGLTPHAFIWLAPVGGALLIIGVVAGPAIAGGDALVLFAAAGLGFLVWLAFLLVTGLRLVRAGSS